MAVAKKHSDNIKPSYKLLYHKSIALWFTFNSHHKVCDSDNDCIICIHSKRPCLFLHLKKYQVRRKAKKYALPL